MTCLQLALATMYYSKPKTNNSTGTLHTSVCTQYHRNINDFRGRWKTDTCQSFWFKSIICSKGSHQMHSCEMLWVSFIAFPISKSWTFSMKASAVMVYLPEMHFTIDFTIFLCLIAVRLPVSPVAPPKRSKESNKLPWFWMMSSPF